MHGVHSGDESLATKKCQGAGWKVSRKEDPGSYCGGETR